MLFLTLSVFFSFVFKTASSTPVASQPQAPKQWNITPNSKLVEKSLPVNVVITTKDQVPSNVSSTVQANPTPFSIAIPPQHIKSKAMPTASSSTPLSAAASSPAMAALLMKKDPKPSDSSPLNTSIPPIPSLDAQKSIFGTPISSTPFSSPKPASGPAKSNVQPASSDPSKPSPFAQFSFGAAAAQTKPFAGFSLIGKAVDKPDTVSQQQPPPVQPPQQQHLNESADGHDEEDNYEPNVHFEPVIPLPELVDVKTGEENETILFEHRAKLLRYVKDLKEWKERGLGNIKVMVSNDDPNKVRLLMRREQVFKLCCNQLITKDMKFNEMPKMKAALSWYGKDFSENVLQDELFIIRFKSADMCKEFHKVILAAQAKMSGLDVASGATAKLKEAPKDVKGFGDKFKPKVGSWNCQSCYTQNTADALYCACCEEPKDETVPKKEKPSATAPAANAPKFAFGNLAAVTSKPAAPKPAAKPEAPKPGFGDQFKPKAGSWNCKACYTQNTGDAVYCACCEEPKDETVPKKEKPSALAPSANAPKFAFGNLATNTTTAAFSFGAPPSNTTATTSGADKAPASDKPFGSTTFNFSLNSSAMKPTAPAPAPAPLQSDQFSFVFNKPDDKPQPVRTEEVEDVSDNENVVEEENTTYFTPVIPLPEKIDVKTGEEDENVLFTQR